MLQQLDMGFIVVSRSVQVGNAATAQQGILCSFKECGTLNMGFIVVLRSVQEGNATTAQHGIHCSFKECSGEDHYNS